MQTQAAKCPNCGAAFSGSGTLFTLSCDYCGSSFNRANFSKAPAPQFPLNSGQAKKLVRYGLIGLGVTFFLFIGLPILIQIVMIIIGFLSFMKH